MLDSLCANSCLLTVLFSILIVSSDFVYFFNYFVSSVPFVPVCILCWTPMYLLSVKNADFFGNPNYLWMYFLVHISTMKDLFQKSADR